MLNITIMTPDEHATAITQDFTKKAYAKYMAGVREHGEGLRNLPSLQLVEEAMNEAIDSYVYLYTLKEQLQANRSGDAV